MNVSGMGVEQYIISFSFCSPGVPGIFYLSIRYLGSLVTEIWVDMWGETAGKSVAIATVR